jgi:hypothetical protein
LVDSLSHETTSTGQNINYNNFLPEINIKLIGKWNTNYLLDVVNSCQHSNAPVIDK